MGLYHDVRQRRGRLVVKVIEQAFEDASEQDSNGWYDYYYSGVIYRLVFPGGEFRARRYDDVPGEAHFLAYGSTPGGERQLFEAIPYDNPEFRAAAAYLRDTVGADTVKILLPSGYVPVDFTQFPGLPQPSADVGELFHCFQCRTAIPEGLDRCPACGWTWQ
jgi:hypothetical protein